MLIPYTSKEQKAIFIREIIYLQTKFINMKLIFIFVLMLSLFANLILAAEKKIDTKQTVATANVTKQVAIGLSTNLDLDGVKFLSLDPGTSDNEAQHNSDVDGNTSYWVEIDQTTNTYIDICTKDNAPLTHTDGTTTIPNSGFTWNVTDELGGNAPSLPGNPYSTVYDTENLVAKGKDSGKFYLRFWLDIPSAQKAGNYNNTIYWCGNENSTICNC
jgi:hypothetical protein